MLELNARPGLNIQIANDTGLAARCKQVEDEIERLNAKGITLAKPAKRMAFCQREFAQPLQKLDTLDAEKDTTEPGAPQAN
jgi:hypothetical protein